MLRCKDIYGHRDEKPKDDTQKRIELKRNESFYLNGKNIMFKVVNRGLFWQTSGCTTSKAADILGVNLIKNMNMNAVRSSHYLPDKHFLEICNILGLSVIDELTGWQ